ncbi:MAG: TetR/AcrR family transcriptional regulator [Anaerolineales bacterium]
MTSSRELSEKRRAQVHEAALACFSDKGYYQTTMDDIAAASGLSKGTLYLYFEGKKDLFLSLCRRVMDEFEQVWRERLADDAATATDKLVVTLALFRQELDDWVPLLGVIIEAWALMRHDKETRRLLEEMYRPYLKIMGRIIREGVDSGELRARSPDTTALVFMTFFDGLMLAMGTDLWEGDWEEIVDAAEELVLHGLKMED